MEFISNDGGRSSYFKGSSGDCAVRALAIYLNEDYKEVYDSFNPLNVIGGTPRNGNTPQKIFDVYCKRDLVCIELHGELDVDELSQFNIIIEYDNHVHACLKGVIHDTHQKHEPFEAHSIWCHKDNEEKIEAILNGYIQAVEPDEHGLTWVS